MTATLLPASDDTASLPTPHSARMSLLRVGICHVWEYPYDTRLVPEAGWMHLRGHNESGKSKALEVALPAVLDARFTSRRLTPSGDESRPMRENMIGPHTTSEAPIGYVFCEFGRTTPDGIEEYFTCGYGVKATRKGEGFTTWQFTLEQARIDQDVDLFPDRVGLSEAKLVDALGDHGRVYGTGGKQEYRDAVNGRLFGLAGHQYDRLMDLLIELRRPQLGSRVKIADLDTVLRTSLATLRLSRLEQVTESMDRIEETRRDLAGLKEALGHLTRYRDQERSYLAAVALRAAASVGSAFARIDRHNEQIRLRDPETGSEEFRRLLLATPAADRPNLVALPWLIRSRTRYQDAIDRVDAHLRITVAQRTALENSAEFTAVRDLDRLNRDLIALRSAAKTAAAQLDRHHQQLQREGDKLARDTRKAEQAASHAEQAAGELQPVAATLGLTTITDLLGDVTANTATLIGALSDHTDVLNDDVATLGPLNDHVDRLRDRAVGQRATADQLIAEADEMRRRADTAATTADQAEAKWREEAADWASASPETITGDGNVMTAIADQALHDTVATLRTALTGARDRLTDQLATMGEKVAGIRQQHQETLAEIERLGKVTEVLPDRPAWRARNDGVPLYRCVEPAVGLTPAAAGLLEGAMVAAGLADAIVGDGTIRLDDIVIGPGPTVDGPTLAELLVPAPDSPVDSDVITRILAGIGTDPDGPAPVVVSADGRWRTGPAEGSRSGPEQPELISQAARQRRRAERITQLTGQAELLASQIAQTDQTIAGLHDRRDALDRHTTGMPATQTAEKAHWEAERLAVQAGAATEAARDANDAAEQASLAIQPAARELSATAQSRGRGPWAAAIPTFTQHVDAFTRAADRLTATLDVWKDREADRAQSDDDVQRRTGETAVLRDHRDQADAEVAAAQATIEIRTAALGDTKEELVARKDRLDRHASAQTQAIRRLRHHLNTYTERVGAARQALDEHRSRLAEAQAARTASMRRFADLHDAGALAPAAAHLSTAARRTIDLPDGPVSNWQQRDQRDLARTFLGAVRNLPPTSEARETHLEERLGTATTRILRQRDELKQNIRPHRFDPRDVTIDSSVVVIRCHHDGIDHDAESLVDVVQDEIDRAQRRLTDEERRVIEDFLSGEVRRELSTAMAQARDRVDRIRTKIASVQTNSGRRMELVWEVDRDTDAAKVIPALLKALNTQAEKDLIAAFFRQRLETARHPASTDDERSNVQRVADELDYRNWFRFGFRINDPNLNTEAYPVDARGFVPLTDRLFGKNSGGSMSVLVHLPLLSAAASFYDSAVDHAPRLIVLDEVLAGVDDHMTEELLDLCRQFDFDMVTTGYLDWLAYPSVEALAIYDIYRDKDAHQVEAERYTWDGRQTVGPT